MNLNHCGGTFPDALMKLTGKASDHMNYKKSKMARQLRREKQRSLTKRRQLKSCARGFG